MKKFVQVLFSLWLVLLFGLLDGKPPHTSNRLIMDASAGQMFPSTPYYLMPRHHELGGGGIKLIKTGNSTYPNTILQYFPNDNFGLPIHLYISVISLLLIFEGIPLAICMEQNPACVISSVSVPIEGSGNPNSSRWLVFVDNSIQKTCVGTGGPEAHPGLLTYSGTFHIEILEKDPLRYNSYKLVFCFAGSDYKNCSYIGTYDNGEGGRRLILTETNPFLFSFFHIYNNSDGTIKSVG
ncbi:hypothetical protein AAZX31_16G182700 [Glycine max]|uniref:Uncharacterized protein n=1 Tax=Glycine max TaxID=3847 RepID=I1MQA2_SOYBN|nr:Subtilisin inhibitor CLSI-II-like precursor [Glycine max]KAH1152178.1 hypothetical protein GYH30_045604 [Glycine max]KAH1207083.1 Subtilisin inhibitor CLSI-II [Glycine max]KRH09250.1 hypothetical protein GLYMA_16G206100v4 [Glycine max]|eukprot:NP_001237996.2 uncharacterized protein LOC100305872 precursor [Glycine max]